MNAGDRLVVALLAAGRSQRFGRADKLLEPLGGKPLILWAAQAGAAMNAAQHIAVVSAAFPAHVLPSAYDVLVNPAPAGGLSISLRIAAAHARLQGAAALLVLLADMPLVSTEHLQKLLDRGGHGMAAFTRRANGPPQPPALFPASSFPALEALTGDKGARALAVDADQVDAAPDMLHDVDTPEDLAACEALLTTD